MKWIFLPLEVNSLDIVNKVYDWICLDMYMYYVSYVYDMYMYLICMNMT